MIFVKETSHRKSARHLCKFPAAVALYIAVLTAIGTPGALAEGPDSGDPFKPFEPSISISTDDHSAGAHPDLAIKFSKPENKCAVPEPGHPDHECTEENADEQQDFKKIEMALPQGLVADPNAASICNVKENAIWGFLSPRYFCDPGVPAIGSVDGFLSICVNAAPILSCGNPTDHDPSTDTIFGQVYLGERRPELAEQAHLIALVGLITQGLPLPEVVRVDISAKVDPTGNIKATVDNLPDTAELPLPGTEIVYNFPGQFHELTLTLFGEIGADEGHATVTNPTSCSKKEFAADVQSYTYTTYFDTSFPVTGIAPGFGDGKTVKGLKADYPVLGCNKLPYAPTFDLTLDPLTPGAAPAITSKITQAPGEQTTGKVAVKFPKGFQINFENKNGQCTKEEFEGNKCLSNSIVGSAEADSELLPIGEDPLTGNVFLGPTNFGEGNISLFMDLSNDFLPGGIRIAGETHINADGSLEAVFDEIPELPIKSFELKMLGGKEKGLLRNPDLKRCGTHTIEATFTSHQGRIVKREADPKISCDPVAFAVEYGTRRPRGHPTIGLNVSGSEQIRSVKLRLSRFLRQSPDTKLKRGRRYGTLTMDTAEGSEEAKVVLVRSNRRGSRLLSATKGGAQVVSLGIAPLEQKKKAQGNKAKQGKKKGARKKAGTELWFKDLEDTNDLSLELEGSRDDFLQNPGRCRHRKGTKKGKLVKLNFIADVVDAQGTLHRLSDSVKMKCVKKKRRS